MLPDPPPECCNEEEGEGEEEGEDEGEEEGEEEGEGEEGEEEGEPVEGEEEPEGESGIEGEDLEGELPPPPHGDGGGSGGGATVGSWDPNEKTSTAGLGDPVTQRFIAAGDTVEYMIFFENLATAAAPAQEVFITDALPPGLDWSTLQLREIAWGDQVLPVAQTQFDAYSTSVQVRDHRTDVNKQWRVDIAFSLDVVSGEARWEFHTIDPDTNQLPEDVFAGFLPPNDPETGSGEGHIVFQAKARVDLPDNGRIENQASIVFDTNAPIVTNTIFNTVANAPIAAFDADPASGKAPVTVTFTNRSTFTPGALMAYGWDFGDGGTSADANPVHTFAAAGNYEVQLNVTTAVGQNRVSRTITVTAPSSEGEVPVEGETPVEGESPAEGEPVPAQVDVPDLVGLSRTEAIALLESMLFQATVSEEDSKAPKDEVTAQVPEAGTTAEQGSTVVITVSTGDSGSLCGCGPARRGKTGFTSDLVLLCLLVTALSLSGPSKNIKG